MNANIASCVICSKPLPAASAATDGHGFPVHKQCYALVTRTKGIKGDGTTAIRCPYCFEDRKFKLMNARADGEWFFLSRLRPRHHARSPSLAVQLL
jgi:hypothetical protein